MSERRAVQAQIDETEPRHAEKAAEVAALRKRAQRERRLQARALEKYGGESAYRNDAAHILRLARLMVENDEMKARNRRHLKTLNAWRLLWSMGRAAKPPSQRRDAERGAGAGPRKSVFAGVVYEESGGGGGGGSGGGGGGGASVEEQVGEIRQQLRGAAAFWKRAQTASLAAVRLGGSVK